MTQTKGAAAPLVRTPKQQKALEKAAAAKAEQDRLDAAKAQAVRLAQVVNLHIGGFSLADIGASIGATEAEVDAMLSSDTARYIKSQPALRVYVRNWISERYAKLLEAVWDDAVDKLSGDRFEAQDRSLRILREMERLHGAAAPVQTEVKVEGSSEAVEKLVASISQAQGMGYATDIFDNVAETVPGEVVHKAVAQSHRATVVSGNRIDRDNDRNNDSEAADDDL